MTKCGAVAVVRPHVGWGPAAAEDWEGEIESTSIVQ